MALKGIKVIELAGLAPAPFCGMVLADFGASVIRVDRTGRLENIDCLANGKRSIALNLKTKKGVETFKKLCNQSDVLIEPFRQGVMEKLILGPQVLMATNKRLIYARLTGFGQDGPFANMAGHDINYVSLSGLLSLFGRFYDKPTPPVNYAADFAGGGLICTIGILLALFERYRSGAGQVIDASMVEGTAYVGSWLYRSQQIAGLWGHPRGKNILDTGSHLYDTYETKDGNYMAVGALEPQFSTVLLEKLGLSMYNLPQFENSDKSRSKLAEVFKTKTREEWSAVFDGTDACVTPVLTLQEAATHPHNKERKSFTVAKDGSIIPNPSPKLSRTPGESRAVYSSNPRPGEHTIEILFEYGFDASEIDHLLDSGVVEQTVCTKL